MNIRKLTTTPSYNDISQGFRRVANEALDVLLGPVPQPGVAVAPTGMARVDRFCKSATKYFAGGALLGAAFGVPTNNVVAMSIGAASLVGLGIIMGGRTLAAAWRVPSEMVSGLMIRPQVLELTDAPSEQEKIVVGFHDENLDVYQANLEKEREALGAETGRYKAKLITLNEIDEEAGRWQVRLTERNIPANRRAMIARRDAVAEAFADERTAIAAGIEAIEGEGGILAVYKEQMDTLGAMIAEIKRCLEERVESQSDEQFLDAAVAALRKMGRRVRDIERDVRTDQDMITENNKRLAALRVSLLKVQATDEVSEIETRARIKELVAASRGIVDVEFSAVP